MKQTYKEHTIEVTSGMQFKVTGQLVGDEHARHFETAKAARDFIDSTISASMKASKTKLKLRCITIEGRVGEVTGINTNTSRLTGIGDVGDYASVYPNVTWIFTLLQEREAARTRITTIDKQLAPYSIKNTRGYGRMRSEHYDDAIKTLQEDFKAALEKAEKNAPKSP